MICPVNSIRVTASKQTESCLFVRKRKGGKDTPVFDIFLRIHSLERQNVPLEEIVITEDEELEIKELARRPDIYELFTKSIAPSILVWIMSNNR